MSWVRCSEVDDESREHNQQLAEAFRRPEPSVLSPGRSLKEAVERLASRTEERAKKKDMHIACRDCGERFTFSVASQRFFETKGWSAPIRCKKCREYKAALMLMHATY